MATLTLRLRAHTRLVKPIAYILYPFVWLGWMSEDRVFNFAMKFVRFEVVSEGWGGD